MPLENDLEELFSRQPPYSDDDLRQIIAKMRELRAQYESGTKPKKSTGPKEKSVDLEALGLRAPPKPIGKIKLL
jgi:hypothetical protein